MDTQVKKPGKRHIQFPVFPAWLVLSFLLGFSACRGEDRQTEILWDTYGIPHIFASDNEGLFHAFGWAQMENHGDLLLRLYGRARGRAAEYWGESYLDSDLWVHTNNIPERARQWLTEQDKPIDSYLKSFVDGINDFANAHPEKLSDEVKVVLPVQPEDPLAQFQWVINFHFVTDPGAAKFDPSHFASSKGSNAWAVGPSRSTNGHAMLVANPHLPWGDMFTWFESHLISPDINVYGAAMVGMPFLGIAFNEYLGWTHTNNVQDGADLFELTLLEGGYEWNGSIHPFDTRSVRLTVKNDDDSFTEHEYELKSSVIGPVVSKSDEKALALRIVGLDQSNVFSQYWDMSRAKNLKEFEEAISRLQNPFYTVMYADRDGHIMHLFGGRTPVRPDPELDWWGIIQSDGIETLWHEIHPYGDLPKVIDPESGWLQNANDPPWTTTFPKALSREDFPPYMSKNFMYFRAQRSARMLAEDPSITYNELIAYKLSTRMELADRLLDDLLKTAEASDRQIVHEAAAILSRWDRNTDTNSRGAVLFKAWTDEMKLEAWKDELFSVPWDENDPMNTPSGLADPEKAVRLLEKAAKDVKETYGSLGVPWGDVYRLKREGIDLPANGGEGDPYGHFRVTYYRSIDDNRFAAVGGDSYVMVMEFSDPVKAMGLLSYGNASQPGSPHRTDQFPLYSQKKLRQVWLARRDIEANLEKRTKFD